MIALSFQEMKLTPNRSVIIQRGKIKFVGMGNDQSTTDSLLRFIQGQTNECFL